MQDTVRPGDVDWTGDNPFIYLKRDPTEADWSSLSLYFRVALSPEGNGHAMLVLEQPYEAGAVNVKRLCLTDNAAMARYLLDGFVKKFALFRPCSGLIDSVEIIDGAHFETQVHGNESHTEIAHHAGRELSAEMTWLKLGRAFAVDLPPANTQTGVHEMFSVFQPAGAASVSVNSRRLPGRTVERDFFGGRAQSAALAHSETWVRG